MALINCPECNREVSDKATSCIGCGFPFPKNVYSAHANEEEILEFPSLPDDLNIGSAIVNWTGNSVIKGTIDLSENVADQLESGPASVFLHRQGISVYGKFYKPLLAIHFSQLMSLKKTTRQELQRIDKSVVGRAVVGALIIGPLGAIIGGMTGMGSKFENSNVEYLVINFWDLSTRAPMTVLFRSNDKVDGFITRCNKDKAAAGF